MINSGDPLNVTTAHKQQDWVKFDEDNNDDNDKQLKNDNGDGSCVIQISNEPPEMQVINLNAISRVATSSSICTSGSINDLRPLTNGDVIVTLLPLNRYFPWITPATFRPELVPEEIMSKELTLTVEEYVQIMEQLVNDYRFTLYNVFYKKVIGLWLLIAFVILIALLLCGVEGMMLFALGFLWLMMNLVAVGLSIWSKYWLNRGLERCVATVNKSLIKHKILLGVDDRGRLSCHKLSLTFIYFDPSSCLEKLDEIIEREEKNTLNLKNIGGGWQQRLDVNTSDIVIQGKQPSRISRREGRIEQCFARYSQRWIKDYLRKRLDWPQVDDISTQNNDYRIRPRHLNSALCPCQYIEDVLTYKSLYEQSRLNYCFDIIRPRKSHSNN